MAGYEKKNCSYCNATGKVTCSRCGGKGTVKGNVNSNRDYTCSHCGGSGKEPCGTCGGTGQVDKDW